MKKIAIISGAVFSSTTMLSVLFKILHLQGADWLLMGGFGGLALIFIPAYAKWKYDDLK